MLSPGARLGRYEVVEQIGSGGMGEVYRARDRELDRDVAIKILADRFVKDRDKLARFEQETKAIAAISHPNILAIFDVGRAGDLRFAVMELLEGETLRVRLLDGPLPWREALRYAQQIARGLGAAHAKGIVHRDLKPENIFISARDDTPKILDFGLAKVDDPQSDELPSDGESETIERKTGPGFIVGTVCYMSPEQVRGQHVNHRSDIFAFGVVLYEALVGQPPFLGSTDVDTAAAILTRSIERSTLPPNLPKGLVRLLEKCLQKRSEDRYPSCEGLESALEQLRDADSATSRIYPRDRDDAAPSDSIAVLPFTDMSPKKDQSYLCHGMAEEIINALTKIERLHVIARTSAFQYEGQDVRTIGDALNVQTVLLGSVRTAGRRLRVIAQLVSTGDGYHLWTERFDREMEDVFALQDEIAQSVAQSMRVQMADGTTPLVRAGTTTLDAYTLFLRGRHEMNKRTESGIRRSVEYFEQAKARDPSYAEAHAGIAEAHILLSVYGIIEPDDAMPRAKAAAATALGLNERVPQALASLGSYAALYEWNWELAESHFERAIGLNPEEPMIRQQFAMNVLIPQGRFDEAERELKRALAHDPVSLTVTVGIGLRFYFAKDYGRAAEWFLGALDIDGRFGMAHFFLGLSCAETGDYESAAAELREAIRSTGGSPEMTAALGYTRALAGDPQAARATRGELADLGKKRYVSLSLLAEIDAALGEIDRALTCLEQSRQAHATDLAWIAVRPVFARLRDEPRFQELTEAIIGTSAPRR